MPKDVTPILAQWDITSGCNFRCSFCLSNSGQISKNELDYRKALKVIDRLYESGILFLRILGGEPFFRRDILSIIRYASKKDMLVSFSTNASLITEKTAKELKKLENNISYFQVSLYGTDKSSYQKTTENPKGFQLVMKGIRNLIENKLEPTVFWVLTSNNVYQLEKAYKLTSELGLHELRISPKLNLGRGKTDCGSVSVGTVESWRKIIDMFHRLKMLVEENDLTKVVLHARPLLGEFLYNLTGLPYFYITCKAATTMIYVNADGDCSPCPFADYMPDSYRFESNTPNPMNILANEFNEIWNSNLFELYRNLQNPSENPKKIFVNCPNFKAGRCDPCVFTPCTCRSSIRMITDALTAKRINQKGPSG